jgi:hypothetical protein
MAERLTRIEERALLYALARASEQGWGIAMGLLLGLGLLLATTVLVAKGGPQLGSHLQLLSNYFPGYQVTWVGAWIGFVYGFVAGYGMGRTIATIYNRLLPPTVGSLITDDEAHPQLETRDSAGDPQGGQTAGTSVRGDVRSRR